MDPSYRDAYGAIYDRRTGQAEPESLSFDEWRARAEDVRRAIEDANAAVDGRLREDAKALLAVNFHDMVLLPLRAGGRLSDGEITDAIASDIRLLAERAVEIAESAEVSAHQIVDALGRSWSDLRIGQMDLWE
jgi:hypothetical protein